MQVGRSMYGVCKRYRGMWEDAMGRAGITKSNAGRSRDQGDDQGQGQGDGEGLLVLLVLGVKQVTTLRMTDYGVVLGTKQGASMRKA